MVFHCCLRSHLFYTRHIILQLKIIVKVHGVFPSNHKSPHLHGHFKFTKCMLETVKKSLHHSCRSELTRQGISLPLDRQSYSRRLLELHFDALASPLHCTVPGRCQSLYIFSRISRDLCFC